MSTVWKAYDERIGRPVAVKFFEPTRVATSERRAQMFRRFQQEVVVHARFPGGTVPAVYDTADYQGTYYLVMELVEGMRLDQLLWQNGGQDCQVAASIIVPICGVLAVAHREGIVHRDLKPSNVMISNTGEIKLLDFGIARVEGAAEDTRLTTTGTNPGSTFYMSPEQIRGEAVTGSSDLYSLGCLLYEILTGRRVFEGSNAYEVNNSHLYERPVLVNHWAPDLPEDVVNLVSRLLAKESADRPASADEVNHVLRRYLPERGAPSPADLTGHDPTLPFRLPFAPTDCSQSAVGSEPAASVAPVFRPRAELKDLHHHARALIGSDPAQAVVAVEENLREFTGYYGANDSGVLDLRFDLADALLAFGARAGARAAYLEIEADTAGVPGLELYNSRAEEGILASE
jgi:serine/threonine protein kinase